LNAHARLLGCLAFALVLPGPRALAASADLSVTETTASSVFAGNQLTFTIVVTNHGPNAASSVVVADTLSSIMVFTSITAPAGWTCSGPNAGGQLACGAASLATGASATFTLRVRIKPSTAAAVYSNGCGVTSTVPDSISSNNQDTAAFKVLISADYSLALTDAPDPVLAGNELTYTAVARNNGPSDGPEVTISLPVPAGTTFLSIDHPNDAASCFVPSGGQPARCVFDAQLAVGSARTMTLKVRVNHDTAAGTLGESATLSSDGDPAAANNSASASTAVQTRADVSLGGTSTPSTVTAGTTIEYVINADNAGPSDAADLAIATELGTLGLDHSSASSGGSCHIIGGTTISITCTWTGKTAPGTTRTLTLGVKVPPAAPAGSTASLTFTASSPTVDPSTANNSRTFSTPVTTSARLSPVMTGPGTVTAGERLTYGFSVFNAGPSDAASAGLSISVGDIATFESLQVPAGWTCAAPNVGSSGGINCSTPSMAAGVFVNFVLVEKTRPSVAGQTLHASATVSSGTPHPAGNNTVSLDVSVLGSADLQLSLSDAPDPVTAGGDVTYTVSATNLGPSDARDVLDLTGSIPAGTSLVGSPSLAGGACVSSTGSVTCTFQGATVPGGSRTMSYRVRTAAGQAGGSLAATASVVLTSGVTTDPVAANNSATAATRVLAPTVEQADLSVSGSAAPSRVSAGGTLRYTLTAANAGPDAARDVHVAAALPPGTTFLATQADGGSCTAPAIGSGGVVDCTFAGATAKGAVRTLTLEAKVDAGIAPGLLAMSVTAGSGTTDPNGADNAAVVTATVAAPPTGGCSSTPPRLLLPIVLDVETGSAHFTTQASITNTGAAEVALALTYTPALGDRSGGGTAHDTLEAGRQLVVPDVLSYLRSKGLPIPVGGQQGGTLLLTFDGAASPADVAVTARTTALTAPPQPIGAAGLAYPGLDPCAGGTTRAVLYGLRSNQSDRANVAVFNPGGEPVSFRVTVLPGGGGAGVVVRESETLAPLGWTQYTRILDGTGIANGICVIERTSATGAFAAYLVLNDNATNDGSFLPAVAVPGVAAGDRLTVPVLVETPSFRSELLLSNRGASTATLRLSYRESLSPALGAGGTATLTLAAGEQRIEPEAIAFLRSLGVAVGPGGAAGYAGALRVSVSGVPLAEVFAGARTASPSPAGGQFGLFTPGVYQGEEASEQAILFGLQADGGTRANVAALHAGDDADGAVTLELTAFDGDAAGAERGSQRLTLSPGGWTQVNGFLKDLGVANGWVRVRRIAGTAPWIAYGVVNDGGNPGDRTGDGAFVPMVR